MVFVGMKEAFIKLRIKTSHYQDKFSTNNLKYELVPVRVIPCGDVKVWLPLINEK